VGKTVRASFLFVFLICSIHSAFCSTPDFPSCPPYLDVASTWAGKNYDQALEALMPHNIATTVDKDQWILSIRVMPSFFEELQFTFVKYPDGKVHGMAASPSNGSIGDQLTSLKETHPEKELNELINIIELDRWQIRFDSNKELENKIRFLQEYTLPPERKNLYCLDGVSYEILLQTPTMKVDFSFGCDTKRSADLTEIVKEFGDYLYGYRKIDYDLLAALEKKDIRMAMQLIQDGANPALQTIEGDRSSWVNSLNLRNADLIGLILQKQPELIHKGKPVHTSALNGSAEIIQSLLQAGADINEEVRAETPLAAAADYEEKTLEILNRKANDFELVVNELIKAGADVDKKRDDGMTALMLAISSRHEAIAATLIDAGADLNTIDNCGDTALILAAREGLNDIAEKLLRAGANPKIINAYGRTAIDYASEERNQELIRLLNQTSSFSL
jgi:ankyrin repeat protein